MNRAIVMVGEESIRGLVRESYQLLIRCDYISSSYNPRQQNHAEYLDGIIEKFAERILSEEDNLEVGVFNGFKIDDTLKKVIKINKLKEAPLEYLSRQLTTRLSEMFNGRAMTLSIAETN